MKKLLLFGAIAIVMLVGASAEAGRRARQSDEELADATADGPKGMGSLDISITNLGSDGGFVLGEISATLRLRVKNELAVFLTKIPRTVIGDGFGENYLDEINVITIRNLIMDAFSDDMRAGGIVADFFFPGDGFAVTLKVLDETIECEIDAILPIEPTVEHCPPQHDHEPVPGEPLFVPAEVIYVQDVTLAFSTE
jgi:hypothetical protein